MNNKDIKIVVIGGGHAGVEAALAISRMGKRCYMITMDTDSIGRMSCNPAIGGLAKGHLVREIDALGGIMGEAADLTSIQFKTLNKSKGRAVWSPRAQVDKIKYSSFIKKKIISDKKLQSRMLFKSKNKSSLDKLKDKYTYLMRKSYNTAIKDKQKSDVLNKRADLVLREIKRLETQS